MRIIRQAAHSTIQPTPSHHAHLLTAQACAKTAFSLDGLEQARILYQYSFNYRPVLSVSAYYASLLLLQFFPASFAGLWDEQANLMFQTEIKLPQIIPLYELLQALLEKNNRWETPPELPACLMAAKNSGLRVLGAAQLLKLPAELDKLNLLQRQKASAPPASVVWLEACCQMLQQSLMPWEALLALIALLQELQIRISQLSDAQSNTPPIVQAVMQPLIETTVTAMANSLKHLSMTKSARKSLSEKLWQAIQPLAQRNPLDIVSLTDACLHASALSTDEAGSLLTELFLYLTQELHDTHRCYYRQNDLEQAQAIAAAVYRTDSRKAKALHKNIKKEERSLTQRLYQAFLHSQNYTLWISSIDHFCCLAFVELCLHDLDAKSFPISRGIEELHQICRNSEKELQKDSTAYRILSQKAGW